MPGQYTLEEFGKRIKAKYPQYASFSDADIANKVLAKYPQYKADIIPSINPEARTAGNYASEITRGVGRGIVDDAAGLYQSLRHPIKTAQSVADQAGVAGNAAKQEFEQTKAAPLYQRGVAGALTFLENAPLIGGMVQKAEEGGGRMASPEAAGAAAEGITAFGLPDLAARSVPKVADLIKKGSRKSVQTITGTGPGATRELVERTQEANAGVRQSNADAATRHLNDTLDALHKTQGNELQHQAAMKAAEDAAAETQRALDAEHSEAVQRALQETREKEDLYQQELRKAKDESEAAYQKKLEEVEKKRADAERKRRQEAHRYFAKKAKVQSDFEAAREKFKSDAAKQAKIEPTKAKLKKAWGDLRAAVETAREKALKVGNEKYSTVNEKLNPIGADMETVIGGIGDAMDKIKGSDTEPSIIKDIDKKVQEGEALTYKDLQGYYSELNKELSKGTLAGDVYAAYDTLHDAIGNEMQRIADSQGMGDQLSDARNYWRRMKQTFGKPLTAGDVANQALKTASPDTAAAEDQANRIRLLGSFDPRIPGLFEHIGNLQMGVDALPNPVPEHQRLKSLVDARQPVPNPPKAPPPIPSPEPIAPKGVAPPARVEIPDRPSPVQPKYPAAPERVAPPDRPTDVQEKKIDESDISSAKKKSMQARAQRIRYYTSRAAFYVTGYRSLVSIGRAMMGDPRALMQLPADLGEGAGLVAGGHAIASFLENPKIVKMLTKATPEDVAQIPPELRGNLSSIVQAATKQGIKVSPALLAAAGMTTGGVALAGSQTRKRVAAALAPQ